VTELVRHGARTPCRLAPPSIRTGYRIYRPAFSMWAAASFDASSGVRPCWRATM
jgi:hypothetical protein